jgi:lycopene cyclase domain-containing protein
MSFTYLWINIAIIAGPLWATRDPQLAYRRQLPAVAAAIAVVSSLYITWDSIAAGWGEWSFNPRYVTGIRVFNLPIEEILFFITVPYACLLLYEVVRIKTKQARFELSRVAVVGAIAVLASAALGFAGQGYTSKVLSSCAAFLGIALLTDRPLLENRQYWLWLGVCVVPFLLVNSILTSLPVVQYQPEAIWGVHFFTIPLEDFFYNYSMLSFYLLAYRRAQKFLGSS